MRYRERLSRFEAENAAYPRVVLLGDSLTEEFDVERFFPKHEVFNRGISGDVIRAENIGLAARMEESVFHCCPTHLFLLIGINDLRRAVEQPADRMETALLDGYRSVLSAIRRALPKTVVYVESILPTSGSYADLNVHIPRTNCGLELLSRRFGCFFLNLHPLFLDEHGELADEFTTDGLHLSTAGYRVWKSEIDRVMGWT
jgi:lysophospholipase L1-like esterase